MKIFEPVDGFEPPTCCLQNSCSTTELYRQFKYSSGRRGSNPRPSAWKADALPTELLPLLLSSRQDSNLRILGPKPSLLDLWSTTRLFLIFVWKERLELSRFSALAPKASMSTVPSLPQTPDFNQPIISKSLEILQIIYFLF